MSWIVSTIDSISNKCYLDNENYLIESKYYLDSYFLKSLRYLINKMNETFIYGELIDKDIADPTVSLSNISHVIEFINVKLSIDREFKLKKLNGEKIINPFNCIIKIRILDTNNGTFIKNFMDKNWNINTYLIYILDEKGNKKIITENIGY